MDNRSNILENGIPYVGLRSYNPEDSSFFWGRKDEIERSTRVILDNASTMLFGPSGCGKTSLINAGIIPALKTYQYHSISVRPKECMNSNSLHLWEKISQQIDIIIGSQLLKATAKFKDVEWTESLSLWEKLNLFDYLDEYGFNNYFLIIIDQFEEIFQFNYNLKEIRSIFASYELLCGYYKESKTLETIKDDSVINHDSYLSYKDMINYSPHRFVVALRQDFMFEMESHADRFPFLYGNRVCINPLNEEQAFEIITTSTKTDGDTWFSSNDALLIIKDIAGRNDFQIDGIPEIEVDAMMLSIFLKETCKKIKENPNYSISEEGHDSSSIIKDYYLEHANYEGFEKIEKELVSADGNYRKSVPLADVAKNIPEAKLREYEKLGILNIFTSHNAEWIELRHDKLCTCATYHLSLARIKEQNHKLFSPFLFLLPQGRFHFDNSRSLDFDVYNSYSGWLAFLNRKGVAEEINIDLSGLLRNSNIAHNCTLKLNLNDISGQRCYTEDGIEDIVVKLVKGKLYEISFFRNDAPYKLYYGAHKVFFYYDAKGRLVLIDYFDANNNRFLTKDGFTSILYAYGDDNYVPKFTYYLNIPLNMIITQIANPKKDTFFESFLQFNTWHREGNYGYKSEYDESDIEIRRTFLDKDGKEDIIFDGFSELRFVPNQNGAITESAYYLWGKKVEKDGIHKTIYIYDEMGGHVKRELYYDSNNLPVATKTGYYGLSYAFQGNIVEIKNLNSNGDAIPDIDGIVFQRIFMSSNRQFECVANFNSSREVHNTNSFSCAVQYLINYPNSQIKYVYRLDDKLQIIGIEYRKYYDNKIIAFTFDDTLNLENKVEIEYIGNIEKVTTYNKYGQIVDDASGSRTNIGPNTYVYDSPEGKYVIVFDGRGNAIKQYRCDDNYQHIFDENGVWETKSEYIIDKKIKDLYYLKDNVPFELEPGVFGFEYVEDSSGSKIYELDSLGKRNLKCVKYIFDPDLVENYAFYDESGPLLQRSSKKGIYSCRTIERTTNIKEIIFLGVNGEPFNCSDGWAIQTYDYESEYLFKSDYIKPVAYLLFDKNIDNSDSKILNRIIKSRSGCTYYLDCQRNPVNGPSGWHIYIEMLCVGKQKRTLPKQHLYVDVNYELVDGAKDDAMFTIKKISVFRKLFLMTNNVFKMLAWNDEVYHACYYDSKKHPTKSFYIVFNKKNCREITIPFNNNTLTFDKPSYKLYGMDPLETRGMLSCIYIDQDVNNSKSGCKERDIIISLGSWNVFNYIDDSIRYKENKTSDDLVNDFENIFNEYQYNKESFTITFARLSEDNKWIIYSTCIRIRENVVSIGKMVDRKISKNAYREIFSCYERFKKESRDFEKDVNGDFVIQRVKELLGYDIANE